MPNGHSEIVAIADDLTGALETGAKFAARGIAATAVTQFDSPAQIGCPVLIADTESRHLPADEVAERIRHVATLARDMAVQLLYKKTDSTLRGNIAAELMALLELFPGRRLVYAPAYPELGRTVKQGRLFVHGRPVHETEFAKDPLAPVRDCSIRDLLGGVPALILDGDCNEDIDEAAKMIWQDSAPRLCAGPAALAGALAHQMSSPVVEVNMPKLSRCLVVNGSLHPASLKQIMTAAQRGVFGDNWKLLEENVEGAGTERALRLGECVRRLLASSHFDGLIVFGGNTAFGISNALGCASFEVIGEVTAGVAVSRSGGLWWITKAGGFGPPDILNTIRGRLT